MQVVGAKELEDNYPHWATSPKGYNYFALELSSNSLCELILLEQTIMPATPKQIKARRFYLNLPRYNFSTY